MANTVGELIDILNTLPRDTKVGSWDASNDTFEPGVTVSRVKAGVYEYIMIATWGAMPMEPPIRRIAVRGGIDMIQYPDGGCYFHRRADEAVSRLYTTEKEAKAELDAGRVKWQVPGKEIEW